MPVEHGARVCRLADTVMAPNLGTPPSECRRSNVANGASPENPNGSTILDGS
jgi:hypothetical protein